ncbi:MAG: DNA-3-methyladenine glycosylase family protein [Candidatus Izemoplasmataceae bacterium]
MPFTIDKEATDHLSKLDPIMKRLIEQSEVPVEPTIEDPFLALVDTVIGQQISEHVKAILMERLKGAVGTITPKSIRELGIQSMHHLGISKMKAETLMRLSESEDMLKTIKAKDKKTIQGILKSIKGIGEWTIDMFFFVCLKDPHVFSLSDMGIKNALKNLYNASDESLGHFKDYYHPYESVAQSYLWKSLSMDQNTIEYIKKGGAKHADS